VSPSALAGIVYVGTDSAGGGVVTGTRNRRLPSLAEAISWCDENGLQILNRDELARQLADADQVDVEVAL
jgi:hypothetical protein